MGQASQPGRPSPPAWRWVVWCIYLVGWAVALEMPKVIEPERIWEGFSLRWFVFAKGLHIAAYALFAILSGWVRAPIGYRGWLLIAMIAHACITELLQWLLPFGRGGTFTDVGIDLLGIALGLALSWKWWRQPD